MVGANTLVGEGGGNIWPRNVIGGDQETGAAAEQAAQVPMDGNGGGRRRQIYGPASDAVTRIQAKDLVVPECQWRAGLECWHDPCVTTEAQHRTTGAKIRCRDADDVGAGRYVGHEQFESEALTGAES